MVFFADTENCFTGELWNIYIFRNSDIKMYHDTQILCVMFWWSPTSSVSFYAHYFK